MSDIDDELLALAGDASSDEEEEAPMNISGESSASPDLKATGKGTAKKSSRKANRRQNDSEEEGEA
jgi:RNA polymerase-associated protein RTF1